MVYEYCRWRQSGRQAQRLELEKAAGGWECRLDGQPVHIDAVIPRRDVLSLLVDGHAYEIKREQTVTDLHMWVGSARFAVELRDPRALRSRQKAGGDEKGPRKVVAPMPGRIVRLLVAENSAVEAGQGDRRCRSDENAKRNQVAKKGSREKNISDPRNGSQSRRRAGHRRIEMLVGNDNVTCEPDLRNAEVLPE